MANHHSAGHAAGHDEHAHGGVGLYMGVFVALCVLTSASLFTYTSFWRNHVPMHIGWTFMMAVSCTKAMLVVTFFMHLKWEANWKYVLTIPATIMSIFLVMMLVPDIGQRTNYYTRQRSEHAAAPLAEEVHEQIEAEQAEH